MRELASGKGGAARWRVANNTHPAASVLFMPPDVLRPLSYAAPYLVVPKGVPSTIARRRVCLSVAQADAPSSWNSSVLRLRDSSSPLIVC